MFTFFLMKEKIYLSKTKEIGVEDGLSHVLISIVFDFIVIYFTAYEM